MKARCALAVGTLLPLLALTTPFSAGADKQRVSYFIFPGTSEPLMLLSDDNPMAGGMFTDIVKTVFEDSEYAVTPMVMPWQRMREELKRRDDWIIYGFPSGFEPDIPYQLSDIALFPFQHVAVTLKRRHFEVSKPSDLFGKTVILVENFHYTGLDNFLTNPVAGTGTGDIVSVRAFDAKGTLRMLGHERGDVVIGWETRLVYHLSSAGLSVGDVRFQDASAIVPTRNMHFAFSPRWSDAFKRHVNDRLREMRADGTLTEIFERYNRLE